MLLQPACMPFYLGNTTRDHTPTLEASASPRSTWRASWRWSVYGGSGDHSYYFLCAVSCQVLLGRTVAPQHCTRTPESFDHKAWLLIIGSGITIPSLCSTSQPQGPIAGHKICMSTVIYFRDCQWNSHFHQCKMGSPPGMGLQWSSQTSQPPDMQASCMSSGHQHVWSSVLLTAQSNRLAGPFTKKS